MSAEEQKKNNKELLKQMKFNNIIKVVKEYEYEDKIAEYHYLRFNSLSKLESYYKEAKKLCTSFNFGGDIYEQNSFIQIDNNNNISITISAPKYSNGDRDWISYYPQGSLSDEVSLIVPISISVKKE